MPDIQELEGFPAIGPSSTENDFAASGAGFCSGVQLTASATLNVKGSWTELITATSKRTVALNVFFGKEGTPNQAWLIDIGSGSAGNETVLIPNLFYFREQGYRQSNCSAFIFVDIPAGTRIAARCQANVTASNTIYLVVVAIESS